MQEQNAEASECRWIVGAFVACGSSIRANGLFRKLLIGKALARWLAALDDFRNWLIREAA